ncbi:tandem-95 repeat protein [Pseudoalteromonas sp. S16_S37]|uniref:tandem-95 repeat protein n=1 Tax=Pseudoalteromonas sp. S16_S37 TaxID=2720228 RepID=UPI001681395C|nr:tandem-95 repeat protein [Pseudoalteromonas sp. S16_S37]MBD1582581.1 tandem-95 repeat protein [Pseudoalteromonas sp. S16_S37]
MSRVILSFALILLCAMAKPALSAGFDFPTHLQFMLKNLRENAQDNSAPTVTEDHITLSEDQASLLDLLGNDIDADKDTLKIVSVSAKLGEVILLPNGQVKYIPPANFAGQDEITYMLYDGRSNPVAGRAYITVHSINDAPVAQNDAVTLIANTTALVKVLENDSDVDGDALIITQVSAKHGQVLVKSNAIEYQPYFDFDGSDVIDYVIKDSAGATASAKVFITVLKENKTAPEITAQQPLVMDEDTALTLNIEHITYIDRDSLPADIVLEVAQGQNYTVDGLTITPIANFNGELIVPITLFDGKHRSEIFDLKLIVNEVNDFPQAGQIIWESVKDEKFTIYMRGMMHDPDFDFWPLGRNDPRLKEFKYIFSKNAVREDHGGWTDKGGRFVHVPGARDDVFEYTPPSGFVGRDYVFFFVYDDQGAPSGRGDITIDVKEQKDSPVIVRHNNIGPVHENSTFTLSTSDLYIRYKGSDSNNGALRLIVNNEPGYYSYDDKSGTVTIDPLYEEAVLNVFVQVTDGVTTSNKFRVKVPLIAVNEAPVVYDVEKTLSEATEIELDFRSTLMSDPEANNNASYLLDKFTYQFVTQQGSEDNKTARGQLVRVPGKPHGVFKYIPNMPFEKDTFGFWVTDEQGVQSKMGTVVISPPKPDVPNRPDLIVDGSSIQVTWNEVDFATYYVVEEFKQKIDFSSSSTEHRVTEHTFNSQEVENEYSKYRVKACNEVDCSEFSEFSLPSKSLVTTPKATLVGTNSIELSLGGAVESVFDLQIKYNDNDWTVPSRFTYNKDKKLVTHPNLPSGELTYRVRGCNSDLSRCTQWSAQSNTVLIPTWIHEVKVEGSNTTLTWGPVKGADYYDISIKFNNNDWTVPDRFTVAAGDISDNNSVTWNNMDGGIRSYKIRSCTGEVGLSTCSAWSVETAKYETISIPSDTPALAVSLPTLTFINKSEKITWSFVSTPKQDLTSTLFVLPPNQLNMIQLGSRANNQPGSYEYKFEQAGTYRFFAQACGAVDASNVACSERWQTEQRVEVVNQEFVPENKGNELTWPSLPSGSKVTIESASCADASRCDMASLDWDPLKTLTNGETSYGLSNSEGKVYRIKVCIADDTCTFWISVDRDQTKFGYADTSVQVLQDANFSDILLPTTDAVGTLGGQAGVSGGTASYSLPIQIAPGRNGVQPQVSLSYSSRSGNGIAGVGFNLSAGSQISRCSATYAQDGFTQNPQYNDNDRLCLDGQRLIAVSGNYGEDNTIYRTEIESFVRVTQTGELNLGLVSFMAEYADGTVAYFGHDASARSHHNISVTDSSNKTETNAWLISYQHDATIKNYINYVYTQYGAGERLLSDIYYTGGGTSEALRGMQRVQFVYQDRADKRSGYMAGGYYESTKRLHKVLSYTGNTLVSNTLLNYKTSAATGRDLLNSIQQCADAQGITCLPATQFNWQDAAITIKNEYIEELNSTTSINSITPNGDRNGDGARDWPGYYINAEGGMEVNTHPQTACTDIGSSGNAINCFRHTLDFNLDGYTDDIYRSGTNLAFAKLAIKLNNKDGSTANIISDVSYPLSTELLFAGDINGDSYPDVVLVESNVNREEADEVTVYYHTKNMAAPYSASNSKVIFDIYKKGTTRQYDFLYAGDLDGNGLPDFYSTDLSAAHGGLTYGQGKISIIYYTRPHTVKDTKVFDTVYFNSGDDMDYTNSIANEAEPDWTRFYYFADVNGDGLKDWLGWYNPKVNDTNLFIRYNKGNGFTSPVTTGLSTGSRIYYSHYNRTEDGKLSGSIYYVNDSANSYRIADIDNDGKEEVLYPAKLVVEACVSVSISSSSTPICGKALGGELEESVMVGSKNVKIINSIPERHDHNIYEYKAIKLLSDGSFARVETGMHGASTHSQLVDAQGDGLLDMVFNFGCELSDDGTSSNCTFNSNGPAGFEKDRVNISRNYGSGSGQTGADYAPVDMLKSVTNGVGFSSSWQYRPLSSSIQTGIAGAQNLYEKGTNYLAGYQNFASSMYVVTDFTQDSGTGGVLEHKYAYRGAVYNTQGRGFMGFERIIEAQVSRGTVTQSDFEQVFPKHGKLYRQATFLSSDYASRTQEALNSLDGETQAIKYTELNWDENAAHDVLSVSHIYQSQSTSVTRDLLTKSSVTTSTMQVDTIDECGNVTKATHTLKDEWGEYTTIKEQVVTTQCANADAVWWPSQVTSSTVTKSSITKRHSEDPVNDTGNTDLDSTVSVVTQFSEYQPNRKPKTVTVSGKVGENASGKGKTTTTLYNLYGLPSSITETAQVLNSDGQWGDSARETSITYNTGGDTEPTEDGYFPYTVKNAKGHFVKTYTNPATGQPNIQKREVSKNTWVSAQFGYDDFYRPFSQKVDGMLIQYSAIQQLVTGDEHKPAHAVMVVKQVSAGTPEVRVYKDKLGRTIRTASQAFDGSWVYQDVNFDALGRTTFESMPYKAGGASYGTAYSGFDELDRPSSKAVDQECGESGTGLMTVNYGYSGLETTINVSESCYGITLGQMSRTYNSLKQLVHTQDAHNGDTYYGYNSLGLPAVIQDAAGNQIKATYNALGRKTKVDDPNQGVTTFAYNGFGELQQEVRANGTTVKYLTDALGRVSQRSATGEQTLSYSYDGTNGYGQMTSASGNGVSHTYNFDALGRPSSHTVTGSGKSYTTTTFYDGNYGRVKGVRYPNDLTLEYTYNDLGYQESVKNAANDYVYQAVNTQDILGNIIESKLGNGLTQKQFYSLASGQMTGSHTATEHGGQLMSLNYNQYDGFGNLKAMRVTTGSFDNQHSFSESYEYDGLHRLTSNKIDGITTISYDYDAIGNLTKKSDYASEYNYADHLSGYSGGGANAVKKANKNGTWVGFSYDARGNMTEGDGLSSAIYNAMDKPTSITKNGITSTFVYGPDHMRFKQVKGNITTYYAGAYEEEVEGTKTTWRAYIGDIAVVSQGTGEVATIRYTHRDRLGSARLFTDHNGKVIAERNFDPFGKPRESSGDLKLPAQLGDKALTKTNRGFTDHEHLDELELIHMNGRVYDYNLGRFMSVDPLIQGVGNSQGINPYSYIMNNPLAGTDPTGYKINGSDCDDPNGSGCSPSSGVASVEIKSQKTRSSFSTGSAIAQKQVLSASGTINMANGTQKNFSVNYTTGNAQITDLGGQGGIAKDANISGGKDIITDHSYMDQVTQSTLSQDEINERKALGRSKFNFSCTGLSSKECSKVFEEYTVYAEDYALTDEGNQHLSATKWKLEVILQNGGSESAVSGGKAYINLTRGRTPFSIGHDGSFIDLNGFREFTHEVSHITARGTVDERATMKTTNIIIRQRLINLGMSVKFGGIRATHGSDTYWGIERNGLDGIKSNGIFKQ